MADNASGKIAKSYPELQSLTELERAWQAKSLPKASSSTVSRAALIAAEVAFHNLADLLDRATADVHRADWPHAAHKWAWIFGFHEILLELGSLASSVTIRGSRTERGTAPAVSPGYNIFVKQMERAAEALLKALDSGGLRVGDGIDSTDARSAILRRQRMSYHHMLTWIERFGRISLPLQNTHTYSAYIGASSVDRAVHGMRLAGDTYFMQFRALHQIPEVLGWEANDHIAFALSRIAESDLIGACRHIRYVNSLMGPLLAALRPLIVNLSAEDYHMIRENLGKTSGSHSRGLSLQLFTDSYLAISKEVSRLDRARRAKRTLKKSSSTKTKASRTGLTAELLIELTYEMRSKIEAWRDIHLHLPRNVLGGDGIRSLIGAVDAVKAAQAMRDNATRRDPLAKRGISRLRAKAVNDEDTRDATQRFPLTADLDRKMLAATGQMTRARFIDVQERRGYFAPDHAGEPSEKEAK